MLIKVIKVIEKDDREEKKYGTKKRGLQHS
jgi:hypothetical protein